MKYVIDKTLPLPAYEQLYRQLRQDILEGALPSGSKLPSKRLLAEETGLGLITVEHAYALLCDEGYALSRQRSGYYVSFGVPNARPGAPRPPLSQLSAAVEAPPPDFPFSLLSKTMRRVLTEYDRRILIKSPNRGSEELRQAIAGYLYRSRGIEADPACILIGSGAEYLYGLAAQLLRKEGTFALEDPSYDKIRRVYEAHGIPCTLLKLGQEGIESDALLSTTARVLHVTPFHSYPSGVTATASKRHEYAQWALSRNSYIIEDDYDSEFASPGRQIETIFSLAPGQVLYINTFTKTIAPAMRMGYMLLPPKLLERFEQELDFYSCTVPIFEQYVLSEFINSGDMERYINRRRRQIRQSLQENGEKALDNSPPMV